MNSASPTLLIRQHPLLFQLTPSSNLILICHHPSPIIFLFGSISKAEFLDVIGTKVLRVFPPCYSQTPAPFHPLEQIWFETGLLCKTLYTETSSLKTIRIMPRNLNEIVRSWILNSAFVLTPNYCSYCGNHLQFCSSTPLMVGNDFEDI